MTQSRRAEQQLDEGSQGMPTQLQGHAQRHDLREIEADYNTSKRCLSNFLDLDKNIYFVR